MTASTRQNLKLGLHWPHLNNQEDIAMTNDINQTSPDALPKSVAAIVAEIQALLGDEYPITVKPITEEDLE